MITTSTGVVCYDADFYPYGGERVVTDTCSQSFKFTGKYRDSETGNDYFGARYYTSSFGRFLSPDWSAKVEPVPYAKLGNPQTLNLYLYAGDNPESVFDPDGHCGPKDKSPCQITVTQIKQTINFYDKSGKVYSTVEVTTNLVVVSNADNGAVVSASASATAANVSGQAFSKSQLATIGSTIGAVQQAGASMSLGSNPTQLLTAITAKESTLGITSPTNPLQLACSSGTCAIGNREGNIQGALNLLQSKGKRNHFAPGPTYRLYNSVPNRAKLARNVARFLEIYNGMSQRLFSWSPQPPALPLPPGLQ